MYLISLAKNQCVRVLEFRFEWQLAIQLLWCRFKQTLIFISPSRPKSWVCKKNKKRDGKEKSVEFSFFTLSSLLSPLFLGTGQKWSFVPNTTTPQVNRRRNRKLISTQCGTHITFVTTPPWSLSCFVFFHVSLSAASGPKVLVWPITISISALFLTRVVLQSQKRWGFILSVWIWQF
jgi:hypothetical protein